mmetsp:Transcript_23526/g.33200  ORF Transcript_23526/g.33200 Transcript_23526/m.33200 type:complete len:252 (-) Transcript_23526:77-832(-)|eukprot:CAMPEP_0175140296 /NCGR_PEP_ID=MMETSP0087-20121206/11389_1 /TAXON_ID=136419 /ORGANISM="Unknown Unknown, Strain D1" /LENGTH=251 /DNA_ID=CAMNT_0016423421 /DNA_START=9 /DNA_END=764 /DNA_ORIENTATION=+
MISLKGGKSENQERYAKALGLGKGSKGGDQLARAMMGMDNKPEKEDKEAPSIQAKTESRPEEAAQKEDDIFDSDLDLEDDDEIMAKIRAKREAEMKQQFAKVEDRRMKGHGWYQEVKEDEFLPSVTKSYNVVCHFFHADFPRCKIIDKHMSILAQKYHETKFIMINAAKAPFFVQKLQIQTLPTVVYFRNGIAVERSIGFEDFGLRDDFKTEAFEKVIRKYKLIPKAEEDSDEEEELENLRFNPIRLTEQI